MADVTSKPTTPKKKIVVGLDGSDGADEALEWAAEQARATGGRLLMVATWHVPGFAYGAPMPVPGDLDFSEGVKRTVDKSILDVLGPRPDIEYSVIIEQGYPALRLLEASADADLLVVGSRGHGEFTGMLLGSVSQHCVSHASCPVVVVRHGQHGANPEVPTKAPTEVS